MSVQNEWSVRTDKRSGDMAHGITFIMHEREGKGIRSEVTVNDKKIHTDGRVSITLALDQHKYGDELIFQMFSRSEPRILERRADGWNRVQIYAGIIDEDTADSLIAIATEIRNRLRAKEIG